ncbi:MAG: prepilin peptidase [Acidobacteriota bacterium]
MVTLTHGLSAFGAGLLLGAIIRRLIPWLLRLKDRSLPFAGPFVEVGLATLFAVTWWRLGWRFGPWPYIVAMLLLGACACDYLVKLIPDVITLPGTLLAIAWAAFGDGGVLLKLPLQAALLREIFPELTSSAAGTGLTASAGALTGFLCLETLRRTFGLLVGLEVMGFGDSKMALLLGSVLGPIGVLMALPLAFCIGVVHGLVILSLTGQPHSPFGPPLALGGLAVLLTGGDLLLWIGGFQRRLLALPVGILAGLYATLLAIVVWLLWRTRRRAREYEQRIEDDYRQIEEQLEP